MIVELFLKRRTSARLTERVEVFFFTKKVMV